MTGMPPKNYTITISGKGGTGKTVIAAIMIKLLSRDEGLKILAIDADPATSLATALGIKVRKTIGDVREKTYRDTQNPSTGGMSIPLDVPLDMVLEHQITELMVHTPSFDFLAIGRPEGPGCYCLLNDLLRYLIDKLSKKFDVTFIDCEAGLEHLSRRTIRNMDLLFAVTDPTKRGIDTAETIIKLAQTLDIKVGRSCFILNKATEQDRAFAEQATIEVVGTIPLDENITRYDRDGKPISDLPDDSPAVLAVQEILKRTIP